MEEQIKKPKGAIFTPLSIIAGFLGVVEVVSGVAAIKVSGTAQLILVIFVVAFATAVATTFFVILWKKPYVFYPPSEYPDSNPKDFVDAFRGAPSVSQAVELVRTFESNPLDNEARFKLIDSMADPLECQLLILMYEQKKELPQLVPYVWSAGPEGGGGSGAIGFFGERTKMEGTGLAVRAGGGRFLTLSDEGKLFAEWQIKRGRKCHFLWTPFGSWGSLPPGSPHENWIEQQKAQFPGLQS